MHTATRVSVGVQPVVVTHVSLRRGKALPPGIHPEPYFWRDVVNGAPPKRRLVRQSSHVTYHVTDEDDDIRLSYATIVMVEPGADPDSPHDDTIQVDERMYVQRRMLHELIDRQRTYCDDLANRQRTRLRSRLQRHRRAASGLEGRWLKVALAFMRIEYKLGEARIKTTRAVLGACVAVPDTVLSRLETVGTRLSSRSGRRSLRAAFIDPARATTGEKSALLVLLAAGLVGLILALNTVFAVILTAQTPTYQHLLGDFVASILSVLALPIPVEPLLVASVLSLGLILGGLGLFVGKVAGSWMLYLIGDSLYDTLAKVSHKKPKLGARLLWMQRNADRHGLWMLTLINAIPLVPDLLVYPFAVSGMRFWRFMGGIALGTLVKFGLIIGAIYLMGPDRVRDLLSNPFA